MSMQLEKYLNKIIIGNNLLILKKNPRKSIDMIFADPPYNNVPITLTNFKLQAKKCILTL